MTKKVAVIAIGGNSLIKDKAHQSVQSQYLAADETARHIVEMIKEGWDVVIGHGNGPQVGFLLQKAEIAEKVANLAMAPLEVCGAQSQGQIGYQLIQCLQNEMIKAGVNKPAAAVIEQTVVSKDDPAFQNPTKPIGGFMTEKEAKLKEKELGWTVVEDAEESEALANQVIDLQASVDAMDDVIAKDRELVAANEENVAFLQEQIDAYVEQAASAQLLAQNLNADVLVISTAVEKVAINFGKPDQQWLDHMTLEEAKKYMEEGVHFKKGSMAPKIQAIINFLEAGGKEAIITNPENLLRAIHGETGTRITR